MKKLYFVICLTFVANIMLAQVNLAPSGTITYVTGISNYSRINDGNTGTSASIAPNTYGAWFTIVLDDVYNICTVDFKSTGSPSDMYLLFLSDTGNDWDFLPYGSAYFDPPTITNINQEAKAIRFMVDNTSSSTLYIQEVEVYGCTQPIGFGYDPAGNRTSRSIIMGLKKGALVEVEENIYEDNLENVSFNIYPNPTKGILTVDIENFSYETDACISIYDLQGKLIYKNKNAGATNVIDLSNHKAGTYILTLRVGDKTSEWKIVKEQ